MRSRSRGTDVAALLSAMVALLCLSGCNLLASAVPCRVDGNCAPGERCRAGSCVAPPSAKRDAGPVRDAGDDEDDAGLVDGGEVAPPCEPLVVVTAGAAPVPAGHPMRLTFDHEALVALGFAADAADLHLVHDDEGTGTPLPRALDPTSTWNRTSTTIWFPLATALEAGDTTRAYRLRRDATTTPASDERAVFPVADFFERPDTTPLESPWSVPYGGVGVVAGGMEIDGSNGDNRPFVDLALPPQTGLFDLVLGWGFARVGAESEYRVHLHLGDAAAMVEPLETPEHFAADGAAVSLVWAGVNEGFPDEEVLAAHVAGGYTELEVVSGQRHMVLRADPVSDRYDVIVDGDRIGETLPFLTATDVVSAFRLVAWRVGGALEQRRLEYVYLVPRLAAEPTLTVELPAACQ